MQYADIDKLATANCLGDQVANHGLAVLEPKDFCYIDKETTKALELLENNADTSNRKHSLMGYLNSNTCTTSGARFLKEAIMRPFYHIETIQRRLDCIEYLVNRIDTLSAIVNCIKRFGQGVDLETVSPALINLFKSRNNTLRMAEKRLDALTTIESLVSQVSSIVSILSNTDEPTLKIYKSELEDPSYLEILDEITNVIEPDMKSNRGKGGKMFRIRRGVESLFDVARSTYIAAISDLEQYVRELHREDGLPWKINHSESRGYFLMLYVDQVPKNLRLGPRYIQVNKTRTVITCTTRDLMQSNVRANVSYENSMKLANEILTSALASVMNNISSIQKLVDIVAMLDLVTSFAKLVTNSNGSLIKPVLTPTETVIVKARHPVLESVLNTNNLKVVPNDVAFSIGHKNFMLITGPNMGGKSVYLKQFALIQIMAQIGCYVPAESAHIKLMNRIVARSGTSDDNYSNCSSFMWEMKGIASALLEDRNSPHRNVMYIIDEVGRGTSIDDGASYSLAIAEELASRRNCFTIFATHFDQVFSLTNLYRNVQAYHFKYEIDRSDPNKLKLRITHILVPGVGERINYGIRLAEACGLPEEILRVARKDLEIPI